jgi:hypothetical protein
MINPTTGVATIMWVNLDGTTPTTYSFVLNGRLILTGYGGAMPGYQQAVSTSRLVSFVLAADHG